VVKHLAHLSRQVKLPSMVELSEHDKLIVCSAVALWRAAIAASFK
jgi:hypothetical protein